MKLVKTSYFWFLLYFFIAAQIAQVAWPIAIALAGQLRRLGQQYSLIQSDYSSAQV